MAFGNLTVDFRQLSKVPVRDRVALARSPQASEIFGNLTPTEVALLFPDYYKKFMPQSNGGGSMASGLTGAGITTGTGAGSVSGTATSSNIAGSKVPDGFDYISDILETAGVNSKVKVPVETGFFGAIMKAEGTDADKASKYGFASPYDTVLGYGKYGLPQKPLSQMTIGEVYKFQREVILKNHGTSSAVGAFQIVSRNIINSNGELSVFMKRAGLSVNDLFDAKAQRALAYQIYKEQGLGAWEGFKFNPEQLRIAESEANNIKLEEPEIASEIPGAEPITEKAPNGSDVSIQNLQGTATVVPQTTSFDPNIFSQLDPRLQEYYNNATDAEKKQLETAISKLGVSGVQSIMAKHPEQTATAVTDKLYQESNKKFSEASSASNFYEKIRQQFPEKIDINSDIWNQLDPELAKAKTQIVDADTGLVGRDALLAADSAAKVLRNNNYIPRIASGGDNHSANHGSGRDANYSVDIAASYVDEQGKVVPVKLGAGVPEKIKNDMATAAYFASLGSEGGHRIGYPDASSPHSMHVQQDPVRRSAYWGYSEIAKRKGIDTSTKAALLATQEGKRFLEERDVIERLNPDQKAEYFDKITGFQRPTENNQSATVVSNEVAAQNQSMPGTQPQTQKQNSNEINATPLQQSTANTTPAMKLGGDMNFAEPNTVKESMSLVANGKEVAQFNKNENVNVEDGKITVENEFQKKAKETQQKTDRGRPESNQYNMRQTVETPKTYPEQSKYGIVPDSPSIARQTRMAQFGGYNHFSRRSHSS